jgi:hypothetical protein
MKSPPHIGVRHSLHQFGYLGFQILVGNDQRADGRPPVAAARRNRLIDGNLKRVRVLYARYSTPEQKQRSIDRQDESAPQ